MDDADNNWKQFIIPKKKKSTSDVVISLDPASAEYKNDVLDVIHKSFKNQESLNSIVFHTPYMVQNVTLLNEFEEKRKLMKDGCNEKELKCSFAFLHVTSKPLAEKICKEGLQVGHSRSKCLGNPQMGVYVSKHSDILPPEFGKRMAVSSGYLIVFKYVKGKSKTMVENRTGDALEPTPGFDCHVAKTTSQSEGDTFESSQIYVYEYDNNLDVLQRPRQLLPYAFVSFRCSHSSPVYSPPGHSYFGSGGTVNISPNNKSGSYSKKTFSPTARRSIPKSTNLGPDHQAVLSTSPLASKLQDQFSMCHQLSQHCTGPNILWSGVMVFSSRVLCHMNAFSDHSTTCPFYIGSDLRVSSEYRTDQLFSLFHLDKLVHFNQLGGNLWCGLHFSYVKLKCNMGHVDFPLFSKIMDYLQRSEMSLLSDLDESVKLLLIPNGRQSEKLGLDAPGYLNGVFVSNSQNMFETKPDNYPSLRQILDSIAKSSLYVINKSDPRQARKLLTQPQGKPADDSLIVSPPAKKPTGPLLRTPRHLGPLLETPVTSYDGNVRDRGAASPMVSSGDTNDRLPTAYDGGENRNYFAGPDSSAGGFSDPRASAPVTFGSDFDRGYVFDIRPIPPACDDDNNNNDDIGAVYYNGINNRILEEVREGKENTQNFVSAPESAPSEKTGKRDDPVAKPLVEAIQRDLPTVFSNDVGAGRNNASGTAGQVVEPEDNFVSEVERIIEQDVINLRCPLKTLGAGPPFHSAAPPERRRSLDSTASDDGGMATTEDNIDDVLITSISNFSMLESPNVSDSEETGGERPDRRTGGVALQSADVGGRGPSDDVGRNPSRGLGDNKDYDYGGVTGAGEVRNDDEDEDAVMDDDLADQIIMKGLRQLSQPSVGDKLSGQSPTDATSSRENAPFGLPDAAEANGHRSAARSPTNEVHRASEVIKEVSEYLSGHASREADVPAATRASDTERPIGLGHDATIMSPGRGTGDGINEELDVVGEILMRREDQFEEESGSSQNVRVSKSIESVDMDEGAPPLPDRRSPAVEAAVAPQDDREAPYVVDSDDDDDDVIIVDVERPGRPSPAKSQAPVEKDFIDLVDEPVVIPLERTVTVDYAFSDGDFPATVAESKGQVMYKNMLVRTVVDDSQSLDGIANAAESKLKVDYKMSEKKWTSLVFDCVNSARNKKVETDDDHVSTLNEKILLKVFKQQRYLEQDETYSRHAGIQPPKPSTPLKKPEEIKVEDAVTAVPSRKKTPPKPKMMSVIGVRKTNPAEGVRACLGALESVASKISSVASSRSSSVISERIEVKPLETRKVTVSSRENVYKHHHDRYHPYMDRGSQRSREFHRQDQLLNWKGYLQKFLKDGTLEDLRNNHTVVFSKNKPKSVVTSMSQLTEENSNPRFNRPLYIYKPTPEQVQKTLENLSRSDENDGERVYSKEEIQFYEHRRTSVQYLDEWISRRPGGDARHGRGGGDDNGRAYDDDDFTSDAGRSVRSMRWYKMMNKDPESQTRMLGPTRKGSDSCGGDDDGRNFITDRPEDPVPKSSGIPFLEDLEDRDFETTFPCRTSGDIKLAKWPEHLCRIEASASSRPVRRKAMDGGPLLTSVEIHTYCDPRLFPDLHRGSIYWSMCNHLSDADDDSGPDDFILSSKTIRSDKIKIRRDAIVVTLLANPLMMALWCGQAKLVYSAKKFLEKKNKGSVLKPEAETDILRALFDSISQIPEKRIRDFKWEASSKLLSRAKLLQIKKELKVKQECDANPRAVQQMSFLKMPDEKDKLETMGGEIINSKMIDKSHYLESSVPLKLSPDSPYAKPQMKAGNDVSNAYNSSGFLLKNEKKRKTDFSMASHSTSLTPPTHTTAQADAARCRMDCQILKSNNSGCPCHSDVRNKSEVKENKLPVQNLKPCDEMARPPYKDGKSSSGPDDGPKLFDDSGGGGGGGGGGGAAVASSGRKEPSITSLERIRLAYSKDDDERCKAYSSKRTIDARDGADDGWKKKKKKLNTTRFDVWDNSYRRNNELTSTRASMKRNGYASREAKKHLLNRWRRIFKSKQRTTRYEHLVCKCCKRTFTEKYMKSHASISGHRSSGSDRREAFLAHTVLCLMSVAPQLCSELSGDQFDRASKMLCAFLNDIAEKRDSAAAFCPRSHNSKLIKAVEKEVKRIRRCSKLNQNSLFLSALSFNWSSSCCGGRSFKSGKKRTTRLNKSKLFGEFHSKSVDTVVEACCNNFSHEVNDLLGQFNFNPPILTSHLSLRSSSAAAAAASNHLCNVSKFVTRCPDYVAASSQRSDEDKSEERIISSENQLSRTKPPDEEECLKAAAPKTGGDGAVSSTNTSREHWKQQAGGRSRVHSSLSSSSISAASSSSLRSSQKHVRLTATGGKLVQSKQGASYLPRAFFKFQNVFAPSSAAAAAPAASSACGGSISTRGLSTSSARSFLDSTSGASVANASLTAEHQSRSPSPVFSRLGSSNKKSDREYMYYVLSSPESAFSVTEEEEDVEEAEENVVNKLPPRGKLENQAAAKSTTADDFVNDKCQTRAGDQVQFSIISSSSSSPQDAFPPFAHYPNFFHHPPPHHQALPCRPPMTPPFFWNGVIPISAGPVLIPAIGYQHPPPMYPVCNGTFIPANIVVPPLPPNFYAVPRYTTPPVVGMAARPPSPAVPPSFRSKHSSPPVCKSAGKADKAQPTDSTMTLKHHYSNSGKRIYVFNKERSLSQNIEKFLHFKGALTFDPLNIIMLRNVPNIQCFVLIYDQDLDKIDRIPNILQLKKDLRVQFVVYKNVQDVKFQRFDLIFPRGGMLLMQDETFLSLQKDVFHTFCESLVKQTNESAKPWKLVLSEFAKKRVEDSSQSSSQCEAETKRHSDLLEVLKKFESLGLIQFSSGSGCVAQPKTNADYLGNCVDLQLRNHSKFRHFLFITEKVLAPKEFQKFTSKGIDILSVSDFSKGFLSVVIKVTSSKSPANPPDATPTRYVDATLSSAVRSCTLSF